MLSELSRGHPRAIPRAVAPLTVTVSDIRGRAAPHLLALTFDLMTVQGAPVGGRRHFAVDLIPSKYRASIADADIFLLEISISLNHFVICAF